jgi:competence protein ComEA
MKALVNWLVLVVCLVVFLPATGLSAQGAKGENKIAVASVVSVNNATVEQLKVLPGIGDVTARSIVEYRKVHGPFAQAEDLLQVKGIGPQTLEKIRGQISVN